MYCCALEKWGGRFDAVVDDEASDVVESICKCDSLELKPFKLEVSAPLPFIRDHPLAEDFRDRGPWA
jgi:hypothetical protein